MNRLRIVQVVLIAVVVLIGAAVATPQLLKANHIRCMKHELQALAADKTATTARVAKLSSDRWTDGRVGVTADGYVFFYDMHESHGADWIPDTSLFYLPDERRFIITHKHYCVDLSKVEQPKDKAALLPRFR
ncbi:MAG TPA: hypothetical protein PLZ36_11295 [Armatimonadota bacterium]|nr:hypothetical protein [Armatimonadota bacterium]HOS42662.1 hypothetical protein [Armatimonadota bacterium]